MRPGEASRRFNGRERTLTARPSGGLMAFVSSHFGFSQIFAFDTHRGFIRNPPTFWRHPTPRRVPGPCPPAGMASRILTRPET